MFRIAPLMKGEFIMSIESVEKLKIENQNRIIAASKKLLSTQTTKQVTFQEIAKLAGISKRTISNIFISKNNLLILTLISFFDDYYEELNVFIHREEFEQMTGLDQIMALQTFRAKYLFAHPYAPKLINDVESMSISEGIEQQNCAKYLETAKYFMTYLSNPVHKGYSDGTIRTDLDEKQTISQLFLMFGVVIQRISIINSNRLLASELDINKTMDSILDSLRRYLSS